MTQKEPTTSVQELEFQTSKKTERELKTVQKEYTIDQLERFDYHLNPITLLF